METIKRTCKRCGEEKPLEDFVKRKRNKLGRGYLCKKCHSDDSLEFYYNNQEKCKESVRRWIKNNYERYLELERWNNKSPEQIEKILKRRTDRRHSNPNLKARIELSAELYHFIKGHHKSKRISELIGCSRDELLLYFESKFKPGMTWENYNKTGWHIDHIIPCIRFDLTDVEQQKKCFHYTNLQPLWAIENQRKGDK